MLYKRKNTALKNRKSFSISFKTRKPKPSYDAPTTSVEWARIAPDMVVVADVNRSWLLEQKPDPYFPQNPASRYLTKTMEGVGSIATTRQLLDGAIAAARHTVKSDVRPPALTATRWLWRLAGAYHLTHPVPQLLKKASQRFLAAGSVTLTQWAAEKATEEAGHDLLALRDIQSLGYDAQSVVEKLVPPAATVLMDYFTRSARDEYPIDCVGYSYTMERISMGVDEEYIQRVESLLPTTAKATRCLRVHSGVGADADHVAETIEMVAKLNSAQRIRIARACYETALMCFSPSPQGYISDDEILRILEPFKIDQSLDTKPTSC